MNRSDAAPTHLMLRLDALDIQAGAYSLHYQATMENDMKNDFKGNIPKAAIELGPDDLQAISGGISEETKEILENLRNEMLRKAARAAREGRSDAADAYSDALESIARQEDGKS